MRLPYLLIGGGVLVAAAVAIIVFAAIGSESESDPSAVPITDQGDGTASTPSESEAQDKAVPTPTQEQAIAKIPPVTLEEFGDFQCSHCAQFAVGVGKRIKEEFVNTGKIRFVFRHFPFIGTESFRAAEATECAADQNRFWEYHDMVFENWEGVNQGHFSDDNLKLFASSLQLDRGAFDSCFDSGKYRGKVESDLRLGERMGVEGTPTLFLNGQKVNVASYDELAQLIESEIATGQ